MSSSDSNIGAVDGDKLRELLDNLEFASRRENQTGIVVAIQIIRNDLKTGRLALALPAPASLDAPYKKTGAWGFCAEGCCRAEVEGPTGKHSFFGLELPGLGESAAYQANAIFKAGVLAGRTQPAPVEEGKCCCGNAKNRCHNCGRDHVFIERDGFPCNEFVPHPTSTEGKDL